MTTKGDFKLTTEPKDKVHFAGPFDGTHEARVVLKMTNADDKDRVWKVKCTSNAMFKIRPAVGTINKGATAECTLTMKALKEADLPEDNYHLFSVYHIAVDKEKDGRKAWTEHTGDAEGSCRLPVTFERTAGDADKAKDKKEDKPKEGDKEKKEEKEEKEKKEEKKADGDKEEKKSDKKEEDKKEAKKEDKDKEGSEKKSE